MTFGRQMVVVVALTLIATLSARTEILATNHLTSVMQTLAADAESRVRFVEERHSDLLAQPLVLEGELTFEPPDTLERRVLKPRKEVLTVEGKRLSVTRGNSPPQTMTIDDEPIAKALIEAVRGTLSGDLDRLRSHYDVDFSGALSAWRLALSPKTNTMLRAVEQVQMRGHGSKVDTITIFHADGDHTVMHLYPIEN